MKNAHAEFREHILNTSEQASWLSTAREDQLYDSSYCNLTIRQVSVRSLVGIDKDIDCVVWYGGKENGDAYTLVSCNLQTEKLMDLILRSLHHL